MELQEILPHINRVIQPVGEANNVTNSCIDSNTTQSEETNKPDKKCQYWTKAEDEILLQKVREGCKDYSFIASSCLSNSRTANAVRRRMQRLHNEGKIYPDFAVTSFQNPENSLYNKHCRWQTEDDEALISFILVNGTNYKAASISVFGGKRSALSCRFRISRLIQQGVLKR
jgi:hypothetical protein